MIRHVVPIPPIYKDIAQRNGKTKEDQKRLFLCYLRAYVAKAQPDMEIAEVKQTYMICTKRDEGG